MIILSIWLLFGFLFTWLYYSAHEVFYVTDIFIALAIIALGPIVAFIFLPVISATLSRKEIFRKKKK